MYTAIVSKEPIRYVTALRIKIDIWKTRHVHDIPAPNVGIINVGKIMEMEFCWDLNISVNRNISSHTEMTKKTVMTNFYTF